MTNLSTRKTKLVVMTADTVRERGKCREIILEILPDLIIVRLKGMRHRLYITPGGVRNQAAKIAAERASQERKAKRKASR